MDNDHNFPEKLADKVDALIGRHGLGGESGNPQTDKADDRNIPLLTDVIAAPKWSADVAAHPNSALQHSLHRLRDEEIDALSQEIFTRVFDRIDLELAAKLESRLALHSN